MRSLARILRLTGPLAQAEVNYYLVISDIHTIHVHTFRLHQNTMLYLRNQDCNTMGF
jgi:hypothetical protein